MTIKPVLHSFNYCLDFLREQVEDVRDAGMASQPNGIMNHPAWTIGHLTNACQMLGGVVGVTPWLPPDFASRFGTGSSPIADRSRYEPKDEALAMLHDAKSRIIEAVSALNDPQLDQPFPDESFLAVFPTIRHALTQVLVVHTANHVGQISEWRRAMGLPAMNRAFE